MSPTPGTGRRRLRKAAPAVLAAAMAGFGGWWLLASVRTYLEIQAVLQEAEREAARVAEVAARNAARVCLRPVLHGQALAGPAGPDQVETLAGPEMAGCAASLRGFEPASLTFGFERFGKTAGRSIVLVTPVDVVAAEEAGGHVDACEPVLGRLRRAVSHEDACSAWLPGRAAPPAPPAGGESCGPETWDPRPFMSCALASDATLGHAVVLAMRQFAARGDFRSAFELLTDLLRFEQDQVRGGISASWLTETPDRRTLLAVVASLLNGRTRIGAEVLSRLVDELDALDASHPDASEALAGRLEARLLYRTVPLLLGPAWTPPGGWGALPRPNPVGQVAPGPAGLLLRDGAPLRAGAALPLQVERNLAAFVARRCADFESGEVPELPRWWSLLEDPKGMNVHASWIATREQRIVHDHERRRSFLALLRFHAMWRLAHEDSGACPAAETLRRPPFSDLVDPHTGDSLRVEALGGEDFLVAVVPDPFEPYSWSTVLRCPTGGRLGEADLLRALGGLLDRLELCELPAAAESLALTVSGDGRLGASLHPRSGQTAIPLDPCLQRVFEAARFPSFSGPALEFDVPL